MFAINLSFVMPGHSRPKDGVASLAYGPGIHEAAQRLKPYGCYVQSFFMDCRGEPGNDEREDAEVNEF